MHHCSTRIAQGRGAASLGVHALAAMYTLELHDTGACTGGTEQLGNCVMQMHAVTALHITGMAHLLKSYSTFCMRSSGSLTSLGNSPDFLCKWKRGRANKLSNRCSPAKDAENFCQPAIYFACPRPQFILLCSSGCSCVFILSLSIVAVLDRQAG